MFLRTTSIASFSSASSSLEPQSPLSTAFPSLASSFTSIASSFGSCVKTLTSKLQKPSFLSIATVQVSQFVHSEEVVGVFEDFAPGSVSDMSVQSEGAEARLRWLLEGDMERREAEDSIVKVTEDGEIIPVEHRSSSTHLSPPLRIRARVRPARAAAIQSESFFRVCSILYPDAEGKTQAELRVIMHDSGYNGPMRQHPSHITEKRTVAFNPLCLQQFYNSREYLEDKIWQNPALGFDFVLGRGGMKKKRRRGRGSHRNTIG